MRHRDFLWRGIGLGAFVTAGVVGIADRLAGGSLIALPAFGVALIGLVLIVQGKRVAVALRIERSRHRGLAAMIHARRAPSIGARPRR